MALFRLILKFAHDVDGGDDCIETFKSVLIEPLEVTPILQKKTKQTVYILFIIFFKVCVVFNRCITCRIRLNETNIWGGGDQTVPFSKDLHDALACFGVFLSVFVLNTHKKIILVYTEYF